MSKFIHLKTSVCVVYVIAMFMAAMDATVVNVALVTISEDLHAALSDMGTINIAYLVSLAAFLPVSGWLGDRYGTKRMFLLSLGLFTIASVLCGLSNDLIWLNFFRIIQGAGGGILTPVSMAILFRTFPPQERVKLMKYLIIPIALAPAMGPVLGGFSWNTFHGAGSFSSMYH